jgi:ubiquinone/menaquinone biosynthesis methyltransferase
MPNLYDPQVVKRLFDEMAGTYGLVNVLSSFGFCWLWRRQCLQTIRIPAGAHVIDLMTGMGELCPDLGRRAGAAGRIVALDISESMCREASKKKLTCPVEVVQTDVLTHAFEPATADVVVSSFGLKTFSPEQIEALAAIVARVLKPGGVFSFVEISVPKWSWLRMPYMLYVNRVVPLIGFLFLGNPDNYRQLGVYTAAFGNCRQALDTFRAAGLEVQYHSFFFGCATGISGRRVGAPLHTLGVSEA